MTGEDVPRALVDRIERERDELLRLQREREEELQLMEVRVVTDEHLRTHVGMDLITKKASEQPSSGLSIRVRKSTTLNGEET